LTLCHGIYFLDSKDRRTLVDLIHCLRFVIIDYLR